MPGYEPAWRRPIAAIFRRTADVPVRWCVRSGVHPNTVSYASIAAAAAAGACFVYAGRWPLLLVPAVLCCLLRLWFNMLDGMVALASGRASRTGEIVNELPDRVSDIIILVAAGSSGLAHPILGYWAALMAVMTAYVGTLGQAVGAQREFSGVMSKPWRMIWLGAGSLVTLALLWRASGGIAGRPATGIDEAAIRFGSLTVLDWTLVIITIGCVQTIVVRLRRIVRTLRSQEASPGE